MQITINHSEYMDFYNSRLSAKTKILNMFRRFFQIPVMESWLAKKLEHNGGGIYTKLVPPEYLYRIGSNRQVERFNLKYSLDISNVVDHYLYYSVKDVPFENFIANYVKKGDTVLDIGVNIGTTITRLARHVGENGFVYGFEPSPSNYTRAVGHVQVNGISNCQIENKGLGDRPGVFKLFKVNEHNPGMNRILNNGETEYPYDEISIITLDDYCREKMINQVNAMKIDVEGFEYFVLKGGTEVLTKSKPVILMEVNVKLFSEHKISVQQIFNLLTECGYTKFLNADNNSRVQPEDFARKPHIDLICL